MNRIKVNIRSREIRFSDQQYVGLVKGLIDSIDYYCVVKGVPSSSRLELLEMKQTLF